MRRIATNNRDIDKFGQGKDGFRAGVPGLSDPTYLSAIWCEEIQESIARVIERTGGVLAADNEQLANAIFSMASEAQVSDYATLRAYGGNMKSVYVTGFLVAAQPVGIAGLFVRDDCDILSLDNGGTVIVAANGKRWKRAYRGDLCVDWFGADPTGAGLSHIAINAAFASVVNFSGAVGFSRGNYNLGGPIKTTMRGMILRGASLYGTYFTAPAGSVFDMLRIAHQQCEVSGILFRPATAAQIPMRIYAGRAHIHDNYMLAAVNNSGTGIILTDIDPDTLAFVPGAYAHTLDNNTIGDAGFAFANGITETSSQGITATKFRENRILSDRPIAISKGGGNAYVGNLLQSSTGTAGAKAGVGISLGAGVSGETINGRNYFELFTAAISTANASTANQIFSATGNHFDNCASPVSDAGSKNYILEDPISLVENRNGWSTSYASANLYSLNCPSGKTTFASDNSGNCFLGATSGANHIINRQSASQGDLIVALNGAGSNAAYFQHVTGAAPNGANTGLAIKANSLTGRGASSGGTFNGGGTDYAEYMRKAASCGLIAKGQIVGINADGELTDKWADAFSYCIKSTNPSYVGGDTWADHLGERPVAPIRTEAVMGQRLVSDTILATPDTAATEGSAAVPGAPAVKAVYEPIVLVAGDTDEEWAAKETAYALVLASWEAAHEESRILVDRIAFAGQVPVNVVGAQPGDYIIPVQDGEDIKGIAVAAPTFEQYMLAVGKVETIEADGRPRIIVKVA